MAATKYQVLYRFTNSNSNQFLLNDTEEEYKEVFELYHDKHKLAIGTEAEILEANNEKSNLIIEGNSTANNNYNMLFKFTGTKRINKKVWIPETIGYVIRDKEAVRSKITRAVDGDYTGEYLLIEGDSIENGIIVCRKNPVTGTINIEQSDAANKTYFVDINELTNTLINKTIAQINFETIDDFGVLDTFSSSYGSSSAGVRNISIKIGYNFELRSISYRTGYSNYSTANNALSNNEYSTVLSGGGRAFSRVTIKPEQVQTYTIPAHYEEVAEYPYIISDTYKRVEQSPWFILSTHASLTSALEKAKALVKSVGIDNVKVVKTVPTEQYVKIN